jgi:sodium/proline symporter
MRETTAILVTLVAYNVVLLAIGVMAQRRTTNVAEFFLGGRKLGPWVAALSASASSSSAWTLLGVSGYAYSKGLSAIWIFPACVGGFALNWFVLAPRLRRRGAETGALTVIELLAGPFYAKGSKAIRWLATTILLVSLMTYVASQFQGAGKTFHETFGLDMPSSIFIGSAIVIVYTMMGGFWAVSLTDTFQGLLMALAAVLLPVAALVGVGGFGGLVEGVRAIGDPAYASVVHGMPTAAAIGMVLGLLGIGLGYPGQPHVVNFFMAMRDDVGVRRARTIAMVWATIMYSGMITLGLCARVMFPGLPDGEVAFVVVSHEMFGPVVAGVLLAAVLAAIMSTVDSQLLVAASAVAHDLRGSAASTATTVRTSRLTVLGVSAAAVLAALLGDPSIFSKVLFAWTAMGAAFGPLLLVELWVGRVSWKARMAAIGVGFTSALVGYALAPGTAWERVAPFALALAVAFLGVIRDER